MLAIVNLVVSDYRAAVGSDLDPCKGVTIDVVALNQASSVAENVNASLVTIKYGISPGWIKQINCLNLSI